MALVVPLSDFINKLSSDESLPICDPNINRSNKFLIIQNGNTIKSLGYLRALIQPQNDPALICLIEFTLQNYYLQGKVKFASLASNFQYEMSFYYVSSKSTIEFLETLNVSDVTMDSSFHLKKEYNFFHVGGMHQDKFVNEHLCLIVTLKRKDSISIKLEIPNSDIPAQFASLYKDQLLTDFKIICGNKEFSVHKAVLAARCTVFRAMFQHETKETLNNQMEIIDFKPKIVEEMVAFLYEDKISTDLTKEELEKMVMIADKYSLEKLKMICMQEMTKAVGNISDALEAFSIAKSHNVPKFKEAVVQFIKEIEHFPQISKPTEEEEMDEHELYNAEVDQMLSFSREQYDLFLSLAAKKNVYP